MPTGHLPERGPERITVRTRHGKTDQVFPHNVKLGDTICNQDGIPLRWSVKYKSLRDRANFVSAGL